MNISGNIIHIFLNQNLQLENKKFLQTNNLVTRTFATATIVKCVKLKSNISILC